MNRGARSSKPWRRSKYLRLTPPSGRAVRLHRGARATRCRSFNDQQFALELLEEKHVLVTPGAASTCRITTISAPRSCPMPSTLTQVFSRIEALLDSWSARHGAKAPAAPRLVDAAARFK